MTRLLVLATTSALLAVAIAAGMSLYGSDSTPLRVHDVTWDSLGAVPPVTSRATAAWCGATSQVDRAPNTVAGHPTHWVYAIPSDGEDRLATLGSVMQTDAEETDAWWRAQDATRAPRNDLTQFACGQQLDITTVRLAESTSQLAPLGGRFAALFNALSTAGLRSSFTKYIVYYDAPVDDDDVCGQGGSDSSGFGLAVVYYQSCIGVSTAAVGAHEFLHTLGAVPRGRPTDCPDENDGHTCDDPNDLMYPTTDPVPLSAKTLDPGMNDYYGHGGAWSDMQDSPWLVRLDSQAPFTLSVSGPGSVAADVPGLLCTETCTTTWNAGTRLALQAIPTPGAKLVRWGCGLHRRSGLRGDRRAWCESSRRSSRPPRSGCLSLSRGAERCGARRLGSLAARAALRTSRPSRLSRSPWRPRRAGSSALGEVPAAARNGPAECR